MNHTAKMEFRYLGLIPFQQARSVQNELVGKRVSGGGEDLLLFCEHPPVLTLGKRTAENELLTSDPYWSELGAECVSVDRGGKATYHGPGQILMYPVISLRERRIGVRRFVNAGLEAIASVLRGNGLNAETREDPAGVFLTASSEQNLPLRKIGFAGLRIQRGVSNHGFSFNLTVDLEPFTHFKSCGLDTSITSYERETGRRLGVLRIVEDVAQAFAAQLQSCRGCD